MSGMPIPLAQWGRMSRDQQVRSFGLDRGPLRSCPVCGRQVEVVNGYWTQHSDPETWGRGKVIRQCRNELQPYQP